MAGGYKVREPGSLKEAQNLLVMLCGNAQRAADLTQGRVGRSTVARYTEDSEANASIHMPVDVVRILERACGEPVVTRYLAMSAGTMLVALPGKQDEPGYLEYLGQVSEELGHTIRTTMEALLDGKVTPQEAAKIKGQILKTAAALTVLISRLDRVMESGEDDFLAHGAR